MSWPIAPLLLASVCILQRSWAATHDEIPQCGLTGIYKTRQSVLESPNYPENYPANTCWDYVVRSPYRCPTKFHIQFLDFFVESSRNCTNDYLAIGLENDGDDMDLLCGQVIGIKKYHTPDGVLRLRFFSDASPWTTGKGFKLLVTRLACERENLLRENLDENDEDTEQINAPTSDFQLPQASLPQLFRNLSSQDQYIPYPVPFGFGWNMPNYQLPSHPFPGFEGLYLPVRDYAPKKQPALHVQRVDRLPVKEKPCPSSKPETPEPSQNYLPNQGYHSNPVLPAVTPQYPTGTWQAQPAIKAIDSQTRQQVGPQLVPPLAEACCVSAFLQKRFYLSSPGFPRTAFTSLLPTQQRDCQFHVEKSDQTVCRLRVQFKFFDFGQTYSGTGAKQGNINVAIGTSKDVCTEDYLEIDGERFCGCRSGYVFTALWGLGKKVIRMRMGYSGLPSKGFLLDIFQETCSGTQLLEQQAPGQNMNFQQNTFTNFGNQQTNIPNNGFSAFGAQQPNGLPGFDGPPNRYPLQQTIFGQQQLPVYQQPFYQLGSNQPTHSNDLLQQPYPHFQNNPSLTQPYWSPPIQPPLQQNNFGLQVPQFREARNLDFAKSESSQQPVTVVETNSTRKEFYYYDGDEAFARSAQTGVPEPPKGTNLKFFSMEKNRCSFDTSDVLRLSVDSLWLTKPTCFSPQRSWFSNIFG